MVLGSSHDNMTIYFFYNTDLKSRPAMLCLLKPNKNPKVFSFVFAGGISDLESL